MSNKSMWILAGVACMLAFAVVAAQEKPVPDICLQCICEASSGCNTTVFCQGGVCGLFRITWPYWADGGKPTINDELPEYEYAYSNCANDPYCAANTVQNYVNEYKEDCNDDGKIDCYDFAAIHKLGGYGCKGHLPSKYATDVQNCLKEFERK